jgi:hypothetical protein
MPTSTSTSPPTKTLTPTNTSTRTSIPTTRPTKTATTTATYTLTPSAVPTLAYIRSAGTDGNWIRYIHTGYGFSFSAPPGWIVSELGANFIQISSPVVPDIKLTIGVRWKYEEVMIQRTGVPEGDIILVGDVPFFGENISKGILVYKGRDKLILYHNCTEIVVGERVFTLGFSDFSMDYEAIDLTTAEVEIADGIVASFGYPK